MEQIPFITLAQCQAAMAAMLEAAQKKPEHPVAMAIVDSTGFLINLPGDGPPSHVHQDPRHP